MGEYKCELIFSPGNREEQKVTTQSIIVKGKIHQLYNSKR